MPLARRARRDEQGMSIVMVSLLMVAMLIIAAIALDGGQAYADHRQMQNAADAAALAGARALERVRFRGAPGTDVDAQARGQATDNGASSSPGHYSCMVMDKYQQTIAACTDTLTWTALTNLGRAVGVSVQAGKDRTSAFGGVTGVGSVSVNSTAAASIQPLTGGDSPFMVCGNAAFSDTERPPLLVSDFTQPTGWQVNPNAIGDIYDLHGPQVAGCGSGSDSFKGLADGPFTLPAWISDAPGVRAGPTRSLVADENGCADTNLDNCLLLVPICSNGRGDGRSVQLYCVAWGTFLVHQITANKHTGQFLGGYDATGGPTGTGDPTAATANVVKLIR